MDNCFSEYISKTIVLNNEPLILKRGFRNGRAHLYNNSIKLPLEIENKNGVKKIIQFSNKGELEFRLEKRSNKSVSPPNHRPNNNIKNIPIINQLEQQQQIQPPTVNEVVDYLYNGNSFTGTLVNGLPEGQGIIVYTKSNTIFEGLFHEGKIADQSNGKFTQRKGNNVIVYTGAFKNNNPCGHGKLEFMNKYIYEGDIVNNKKHGKGKITYLTDGTIYEGDFLNDKKHGKGKLSNYKNGFVYEGNFVNDKKHGKGKYINFNNFVEGFQILADDDEFEHKLRFKHVKRWCFIS